jgi:hypothetical protein
MAVGTDRRSELEVGGGEALYRKLMAERCLLERGDCHGCGRGIVGAEDRLDWTLGIGGASRVIVCPDCALEGVAG